VTQVEREDLQKFKPAGLVEIGWKSVDQLLKLQTECMGHCLAINERWLNRLRVEKDFAAELPSRTSEAHSVSDFASIYWQCSKHWLDMMLGASERVFSEVQKAATDATNVFGKTTSGRGSFS
jgi:hypothetical protein